MKIGFASLVGLEPRPIEEVVAWAAANGFQSMEVNTGPTYAAIGEASYHGHLDLDAILNDGPEATLSLFDRNGIEIIALAPMINLLTRDPNLAAARSAQMEQTIDAAAALGCKTVVTFTGSADGMYFYGLPGVGDDHPTNRVRENLDRFATIYGPLAERAERNGVRIAFETAGRGGGEGNLAHNPELWDAMFDAVPSPALGLSFDPSHLVWLQIPDVIGTIQRYADRIHHFDGKDCEILHDRLARQGILGSGWWRYRLPGLGELDWTEILGALDAVGYDDAISIEQEDPVCPGYDCLAESGAFLTKLVQRPSIDK